MWPAAALVSAAAHSPVATGWRVVTAELGQARHPAVLYGS
jgi:hypothetical protein